MHDCCQAPRHTWSYQSQTTPHPDCDAADSQDSYSAPGLYVHQNYPALPQCSSAAHQHSRTEPDTTYPTSTQQQYIHDLSQNAAVSTIKQQITKLKNSSITTKITMPLIHHELWQWIMDGVREEQNYAMSKMAEWHSRIMWDRWVQMAECCTTSSLHQLLSIHSTNMANQQLWMLWIDRE